MTFSVNDGGRGDGFSKEHNDCVPRAIAIGFDIPYEEVHHLCKVQFGRKDGGLTNSGWVKWLNSITRDIIKDVADCKTITVRRFLEKKNNGIFICRIRGHAFCIKDGVIHDKSEFSLNCRIINVWKI